MVRTGFRITLCLFSTLVFLASAGGGYAQDSSSSTSTVTVSTLAVFPQPSQVVVTNLRPDNGSFVTTNPPYIMVKVNRGQKLGQADMYLDGQNVAKAGIVGDDTVSYSPPGFLSLGDHLVTIRGITASGSPFSQRLTFTVQAQGPVTNLTGAASLPTVVATVLPPWETTTTRTTYAMGAPSPGMATTTTTSTVYNSVPLVTRTLTISALSTIKILDNVTSSVNGGEDIPIVLLGRPQGIATFDLVPKGTTLPASSSVTTGLPMTETSPGIYQAVFHVNDAGLFNNGMLVGHLSLPTGEIIMGTTPTVNDLAFYAMYVGNPLYATVWIPNIAMEGDYKTVTTTSTLPASTIMAAPSKY